MEPIIYYGYQLHEKLYPWNGTDMSAHQWFDMCGLAVITAQGLKATAPEDNCLLDSGTHCVLKANQHESLQYSYYCDFEELVYVYSPHRSNFLWAPGTRKSTQLTSWLDSFRKKRLGPSLPGPGGQRLGHPECPLSHLFPKHGEQKVHEDGVLARVLLAKGANGLDHHHL